MNCKDELNNIMNGCIDSVRKGGLTANSAYLIGLIQMKSIVMNYLRDKNITVKQDKEELI